MATGSDALASPPLVSIDILRNFCLNYIKELEQHIGGIKLVGLWGESHLSDPKQLLDIKRKGSPISIQVLDPDVTVLVPAYFRKYADETGVSLIMGIDTNLIASGPVEEIRSRARRFIEEGGKTGRFILFINDIPYHTPAENILAVVSVANEYHPDPSSGTYYVRDSLR